MIRPTDKCDGCAQPIIRAQTGVRPVVLDYPAHVAGIFKLVEIPDQPYQALLLNVRNQFGYQGKLYRRHECRRRR